ncbi:hypothetical protein V8C42DRAFT_314450 [Trichoderma barbatum]
MAALIGLRKAFINDSKSRIIVPVSKMIWLVLFRIRGCGRQSFLQIMNRLVNVIWWGAFAAYGFWVFEYEFLNHCAFLYGTALLIVLVQLTVGGKRDWTNNTELANLRHCTGWSFFTSC